MYEFITNDDINLDFSNKCFDFSTTHFNSCFYSSFIFVINIILCYYYNYTTYAVLFAILLITSIIVHSYTTTLSLFIDKLAILSVVLYGGYVFYEKLTDIFTTESFASFETTDNIHKIIYATLIISTFLTTIYLYYYGYTCNKYCFCEDSYIANLWHSLLHAISSIGHACIVIM